MQDASKLQKAAEILQEWKEDGYGADYDKILAKRRQVSCSIVPLL